MRVSFLGQGGIDLGLGILFELAKRVPKKDQKSEKKMLRAPIGSVITELARGKQTNNAP
jgi:hypothetical protein